MGFIRVILAISVVFQHCPWKTGSVFVGGQLAVQAFYIISGFLISHILLSNDAYQDPLKFYYNRFLRIYPIYWAIAIITLLGAYFVLHEYFSVYHKVPFGVDAAFVAANLGIFGLDWLMFFGISGGDLHVVPDFKHADILLYHGVLVEQAWTLGVELTFYLFAPMIVRSTKLLFTCLAVSAAIKASLYAAGLAQNDPWGCRFFPAELSFFLMGVVSNQYILPFWRKYLLTPAHAHAPRYATLLISGVLMTFLLMPLDRVITIPLLFALIAVLLPLTFLDQNGSPLDKAIGELSYPIYIGHMIVVRAVSGILNRHQVSDPLIITVLSVLLSILFAVILNELLSKPIERYRRRVARSGAVEVKAG